MKNELSEVGLSSRHVKDLRGIRFGKVIVKSQYPTPKGRVRWLCECDCGNEVVLTPAQLKQNHCPNCGCTPRQANRPPRNNVSTHHMTGTRIYRIWKTMRTRCNNPNVPCAKNYAKRGITVCDEWSRFEPFYEWAIANGYRDDLTLDRIDNDGNYEPSNCRFVTNTVQQRNRRKTVKLTYEGETRALTEWCEMLGLNKKTVYNRLHNRKWTNPQEILFGKAVNAYG